MVRKSVGPNQSTATCTSHVTFSLPSAGSSGRVSPAVAATVRRGVSARKTGPGHDAVRVKRVLKAVRPQPADRGFNILQTRRRGPPAAAQPGNDRPRRSRGRGCAGKAGSACQRLLPDGKRARHGCSAAAGRTMHQSSAGICRTAGPARCARKGCPATSARHGSISSGHGPFRGGLPKSGPPAGRLPDGGIRGFYKRSTGPALLSSGFCFESGVLLILVEGHGAEQDDARTMAKGVQRPVASRYPERPGRRPGHSAGIPLLASRGISRPQQSPP